MSVFALSIVRLNRGYIEGQFLTEIICSFKYVPYENGTFLKGNLIKTAKFNYSNMSINSNCQLLIQRKLSDLPCLQ